MTTTSSSPYLSPAEKRYLAIREEHEKLYPNKRTKRFKTQSTPIKKGMSIIIAANSAENYIEDCLDSIEKQTYFQNAPYQIIVGVDGCINTFQKLDSIKSKYRNLTVLSSTKKFGTFVTLNNLLKMCKYDCIMHFYPEDVMVPNLVEEVMKYSNDYDLIKLNYQDFRGDISQHVNNRFWFNGGVYAYNKKVLSLTGGFYSWVYAADIEMYERVFNHVRVKKIEKVLYYKREKLNDLKLETKKHPKKEYLRKIRRYSITENVRIADENLSDYFKEEINDEKINITPNPIIKQKSKVEIPEVKSGISILITAYQSQNFIEECLDSVENQIYFKDNNEFEVLLGIDGCQDTLNKVLEIKNKYRNLSVYMMKENKGPYVTLNTLLDLVKYENLIIFGSDDVMMPFMIDKLMKNINTADLIRFSFNDFKDDINSAYQKFKMTAIGAIFMKKSVIELAGGYQPWRCSADYEFIKRVENNIRIIQINEPLFFRRDHSNSLSNKNETSLGSNLRKRYNTTVRNYKYKRPSVKIDKVVNEYLTEKDIFSLQTLTQNPSFNNNQKIYTLYNENSKNIKLSVAIPCYNAKDIGWLCMEGLCNQREINFDWEIVICEEIHEKMLRKEFFIKYIQRLKVIGCKKITYIELPDWVNLSEKWKIIGENLDNYNGAFVLQAIDDYSPSKRLTITYDLIVNKNYDWIDFGKGYFYSFNHKNLILYDTKEKISNTNLYPSFKSKYAKYLKHTSKKTGIDTFIFETVKNLNTDIKKYTYNEILDGIATDGYNNLSKDRKRNYNKPSWPFVYTNKNLEDILPHSVLNKFNPDKKYENYSYIEASRIKQIRFSESVRFFSEKMLEKYKLINYTNPNKPAFFMGLYGPGDYIKLLKHNNEAVILWCGSDAMIANKYLNTYNINSPKYHHIAFGEFVSKDLQQLNIKHEILPISPSKINLEPYKRGDNIYMYSRRRNPKFYGEHYADEIKKKTGLNIIIAYHDSYNYNQLIEIYKQCFIGLRLTQHDGLPNTVIELGLMGRRCIYNGNLPHSYKWNNINDICENIMKEYNNRHIDDTKTVHNDMYNYLNIGESWLFLEYYKK